MYEKLKTAISELSVLAELNEEQQSKLLSECMTQEDNEIIKSFAAKAYRFFAKDDDKLNEALDIIRKINAKICPPVPEMKQILEDVFQNKTKGNMGVEDNHKLVESTINQVCDLFNKEGIDYYIVGALPCFIKTGQKLFRYHDDIDIMVNEEDIPKVENIMKKMGYGFQDDRFISNKRYDEIGKNPPPHTILAQNPNNEFHVGFFCFRREKDNSITTKEYSHRLDGSRVVTDVLERRSSPLGTALRYDENSTTIGNASFRSSSVESVYLIKQFTKRPKDITDTTILEHFVDKTKLEQLINNPTTDFVIRNVQEQQRTM